MSGNGVYRGYRHSCTQEQVWGVYEGLPFALRQFIQNAPFKASPIAVADLYGRAQDECEALEYLECRMSELVESMSAGDYGINHPQAAGSR